MVSAEGHQHENRHRKMGDSVRTDFLLDCLSLARHGVEHGIRAQRVKVCAGVVERAFFRHGAQVQGRVKSEFARQSVEDV
jgi:hypothetical protein